MLVLHPGLMLAAAFLVYVTHGRTRRRHAVPRATLVKGAARLPTRAEQLEARFGGSPTAPRGR
ncbi:MAG TPA: hypothetical protein VLQ79_04055 [Myxococcaceae bacterium]|nr:hypothetical protein [Myxococcaceae bacterium]